jgi:truncated hemoglobin YjbI
MYKQRSKRRMKKKHLIQPSQRTERSNWCTGGCWFTPAVRLGQKFYKKKRNDKNIKHYFEKDRIKKNKKEEYNSIKKKRIEKIRKKTHQKYKEKKENRRKKKTYMGEFVF